MKTQDRNAMIREIGLENFNRLQNTFKGKWIYFQREKDARQNRYTQEQKQDIIKKIDNLKKQGYTFYESCQKAGIPPTSYYRWKYQ